MGGDCKSFRVKGEPLCSTLQRCGKVSFKARDHVDAALLAMLFRTMFKVGVNVDEPRVKLYHFLRGLMRTFEYPTDEQIKDAMGATQ